MRSKFKDGEIDIDCAYDELVDPMSLVDHNRNNNRHGIEQIEQFAKVMGSVKKWRLPIIISNRSGLIISGHGRKQVALLLGMEKVPVNYQDFESEAAEVQQLTFENEIARWTELDRQAVHIAMEELPELKLELLGIENWEPIEIESLDPQCDEDEVPEVKYNPVTKKGDVWLLGNH